MVGYRAWFYFAELQADRQMTASLDKNQYNDQELLVLSIPLNVPYQPEESRFEKTEGEITLHGTIYKYVKRKVSRGNLILLCLPDARKTGLLQAKSAFSTNSTDIAAAPAGKKSPSAPLQKKASWGEYEEYVSDAPVGPLCQLAFYSICSPYTALPTTIIAVTGKPPELRSCSFSA